MVAITSNNARASSPQEFATSRKTYWGQDFCTFQVCVKVLVSRQASSLVQTVAGSVVEPFSYIFKKLYETPTPPFL